MNFNYIFFQLYGDVLFLKNSKFIETQGDFFIPNIGASIFTFSIPSFDLMGGHLQLIPLFFIPILLLLLERLYYFMCKNFLYVDMKYREQVAQSDYSFGKMSKCIYVNKRF